MPLVMMKLPEREHLERPGRQDRIVTKGRTPIIFHCESTGNNSDSSTSTSSSVPSGRRDLLRRPPPYRNVPSSSSSSSTGIAPAPVVAPLVVAPRITPVPTPSSVLSPLRGSCQVNGSGISKGGTGKPARPKSIHHEFPASSGGCVAKAPRPISFPYSVSLQFDSLLTGPDNSDGGAEAIPVPSPAPGDRRRPILRPSRGLGSASNQFAPDVPSRSCSVPRSLSAVGGRNPRPLSHPAIPQQQQRQRSQENLRSRNHQPAPMKLQSSQSHGHLNHHAHPSAPLPPPRWPPSCFSLIGNGPSGSGGGASGAYPTPAPAPSPSSTPSPSGRLLLPPVAGLAHLPHDAFPLRTNHGIRMLEKKLDLYIDIMQSQERFVQVFIDGGCRCASCATL